MTTSFRSKPILPYSLCRKCRYFIKPYEGCETCDYLLITGKSRVKLHPEGLTADCKEFQPKKRKSKK